MVIKDFLSEYQFRTLQRMMVWNPECSFYLNADVAQEKPDGPPWYWYATHVVYYERALSPLYEHVIRVFAKPFGDIDLLQGKTITRIKINFYPYTSRVREHDAHTDKKYGTTAAIFGLNTCNGFTRVKGSGKIKSVANQLFIFDGLSEHNSSTTSDAKGRFNINFNFI